MEQSSCIAGIKLDFKFRGKLQEFEFNCCLHFFSPASTNSAGTDCGMSCYAKLAEALSKPKSIY